MQTASNFNTHVTGIYNTIIYIVSSHYLTSCRYLEVNVFEVSVCETDFESSVHKSAIM